MIVDSSALLAVLNRELDTERYEAAILRAPRCRMSVANLLETSIVVESRGGAEAGYELDVFLELAEIEPTPVTTEHLAGGPTGLAAVRKGQASGGSEFRRLFRLRACSCQWRAAVVQRRRLHPHRRHSSGFADRRSWPRVTMVRLCQRSLFAGDLLREAIIGLADWRDMPLWRLKNSRRIPSSIQCSDRSRCHPAGALPV